MSVDAFRRSRRVALPEPPRGEIMLPSPPVLPRGGAGQAAMQLMFFLPMMLGMGAMSFVYIGRSGGAMTWIFGALFVGAMAGMIVMALTRGGMSKKAQINDERRDYLRYLTGLRGQVRDVAQQQREAMLAAYPDPADLWAVAGTPRMWERRRADPDFVKVRVGTGPQRLATPLRAPQTAPLEDLDPVSSTSLRHFIRTYATVPDLPVALSLRSFSRVTIGGDREAVLDTVRGLLAQLVTFHAPTDLRVACCLGVDRRKDWEWAKWLPHLMHPHWTDAAGPRRMSAGSLTELADLLAVDLAERPRFTTSTVKGTELPHIIVVIDGGTVQPDPGLIPDDGLSGVTVIDLGGGPAGASESTLDLVIADGRLGTRTPNGIAFAGDVDELPAPAAELLARQLTGLHVPSPARDDAPLSGTFGLTDLLGIGDPRQIDPAVTWRSRPARDRLRLPIGVDADGRPLELDLKESAEGGMGPHGLVIGATGSGKSELLRTLVTGLAATHSSETLNLALIDFKGGATFAGMADLPHTCAVITNLADDLALVDRMADAIRGEVVRRQELLRAAGNFASVRDYERAREARRSQPADAAGPPLRPLPSLLVIIDEFSELLSSRPEFIDLFVMIGRLGRSLGIHLLLASQRLEEGRLRGLDSHLSYRIGLRTFSASESRAVLGVPDAYELPPLPGSAYLKVDTATLIRFKTAFVSGELPSLSTVDGGATTPFYRRAVAFSLAAVEVEDTGATPAAPARPAADATRGPSVAAGGATVMDAIMQRLDGAGPPAYQIWLSPLGEPPTLSDILPPLESTTDRGLCPAGWAGNGQLTVPVAIVDKPFEQRRDLLWADLSGAAGNAVVVGAPQSGKSTLLRTLVGSLALTHTPREVQFFLMDLGGGALAALAGLPHVSGYATRLDAERCRRTVAELTTLLTGRERMFTERGIDSMAAFRRNPPPAADGRHFGDVFLVVDGWLTLRQEYERLEEAITTLAARGLGFGIHVVLSANRWMETKPALRDLIGTHVELRLGDPLDSAIDRRAAANVPQGKPGRGLTSEKLQLLTALPRIDGKRDATDLLDGVGGFVNQVSRAWQGERSPQVRLLPREVPAKAMPAPVPGDRRIPLGIAESDLGPVYVDFDTDPHFLAFGDSESGKTAMLRHLARGITERYDAASAAVVVVDYRRGLLDVVREPHLLGYCGSEPVLSKLVAELAEGMKARIPGPDLTSEQLRQRSWWRGPELFVLVDDYDLVVSQSGNPLAPLHEFLPHAKDIGLHLVAVRRSGGAARGLYEPVLQRMRELGSPGLVMSGSKDEGVLLGDVKPSAQPPGRGSLVNRRSGTSLVQVAWSPPPEG